MLHPVLKHLGIIVTGAIILFSMLFRLVGLDHIPGLNGDEAWYGIQAMSISQGHPWELWAPSARPLINIFLLLPLLFLHLFFDPAFWVVRAPSVVAGILAVLLAYRLFRDIIGRPAAISLALLTATLPINIAYSRFGWDPSFLIIYAIFILYFAFKKKLLGLIVSTLLAITAHPVAIFILPIVVMIALTQENSPFLPAGHRQKTIGAAIMLAGIIAVAVYSAGFGATLHRLSSTQETGLFLSLIGGLFSGETIYRYIVDPATDLGSTDPSFFFATILLFSAILFRRTATPSTRATTLAFIVGILLSLICGYIMFGPWLLLPHTERYGIYLVFPFTLIFVILLHGTFPAEKQHWPLAVTIVLSITLLGGFQRHYMSPLLESGGNSQIAFRTGAVDPKQVAYLGILEETQGRPVRIFAHQWWIWKPMQYLASTNTSVEIIELREFSRPLKGDYVVTFAGEPLDVAVRNDPSAYATRWAVLDYSRREVLAVYRL